jgi:fatty acid desaturase
MNAAESRLSFNSPQVQRQVNELRRTDNVRGWFYIAREYLLLALFIGAAIAFYTWAHAASISWLWFVPVTVIAITLIGAVQQRLATLTHEAAHYLLFRNRLLNELASEWFCMFPIFGTTHSYRVQHLGHHQFPNDPERDPDWVQMTRSGHRYTFPMSRLAFLWHVVFKQILMPLYPAHYAIVRASYVVDKGEGTPYRMVRHPSRSLALGNIAYLVILIGALTGAVALEDWLALLIVPSVLLTLGLTALALIPERWLEEYFIKSDLPVRFQRGMRLVFNTLLLTALAALTLWTGQPCWLFYLVLWVVPLGTSFAFFMILRQVVQHGNGGTDRFTNTRIFHIHWLLSWAIFPIGNDYHLPHHLFPLVPHYNLRKLHEVLMQTREYQEQATLVEGYFVPAEPPTHPTVLDLIERETPVEMG